MSAVSVNGPSKKSITHLRSWIIFAVISLIANVLISIALRKSFWVILELMITISMYGFGIWVVHSQIKSIRRSGTENISSRYEVWSTGDEV
ncbi:unnamed protein product [Allacma fusca]|uniref:Uncharacterized protein n=1 Tax=Allacma fusca TaxID=39272 RepID=A0A8J2KJ84_9HEXA|nr:unnamed protein product [Allacma fusca]